MLNIKAVRANPGFYKAGMVKRRRSPEIVDEILGLDEERRSILKTIQELRHRRNLAAEKIAAAKKRGEKTDQILLEMQEVNQKIEELETRLATVENKLETLLKTAPNPPHESVPDGESEEDNVVVRSWGELRK
ncbi:MAG: hypothetical protein QXJ47_05275, partial [Candidatus Caldarchaeum sp.]